MLGEELLHAFDCADDAGEDGVAVLRVVDGVGEDIGELPGPVLLKEEKPRVDGAGDGRGERSGAGDHVEALGRGSARSSPRPGRDPDP